MQFLLVLILVVIFPGINSRAVVTTTGFDALSDDFPHEDLTYASMIWQGVIEKGGPEMAFSGTLDQVEEQIRDLKPNFTWESLHDELAEDGYYPRPEKRGEKEGAADCGRGTKMQLHLAESARDWLRRAGAGGGMCCARPGRCATLTCDWGKSISMCNENDPALPDTEYDRWVNRTCAEIADAVQDVIDACAWRVVRRWVRGRQDYVGNYFVMTNEPDECKFGRGGGGFSAP